MQNSSIEILGTRDRRRRWGVEEKLRIVAECEEPGATLRAIAARHDVYPTLLGTWRRLARQGQLSGEPNPRLMPVRVAETVSSLSATPASSAATVPNDTIEVTLPNGCRIRVGNDASLSALRRVMAVLRG
jgi:transposase